MFILHMGLPGNVFNDVKCDYRAVQSVNPALSYVFISFPSFTISPENPLLVCLANANGIFQYVSPELVCLTA